MAVGNSIVHPIETITGIAETVGLAAYGLAYAITDIGKLSVLAVTDTSAAYGNIAREKIQALELLKAIGKEIKNTPPRQLARGITGFVTEAYMMGKCLRIAQRFIIDSAKKLDSAHRTAKTVEGIQMQFVESTVNIMHSVQGIDKNRVPIRKIISKIVNESCIAILKDGYYEVNGFKFTEYYYNRLWTKGRGAPSLIAKEILDNAIKIAPDKYPGFFRYELGIWEMIYNPTTKEVSHLSPTKKIPKLD
jgi:hypothetical protein